LDFNENDNKIILVCQRVLNIQYKIPKISVTDEIKKFDKMIKITKILNIIVVKIKKSTEKFQK
jgi:hypothetical protein